LIDIASVEELEREVFQSPLPVLMDFWGPRCAPCLAQMPFIEGLASSLEAKLRVIKVDATQSRQLCIRMKVLGLPTYILVNQGREVRRLQGSRVTEKEIADLVAEA